MTQNNYYKYQWFFEDKDQSWIEKGLGEDRNEAIKMAQADFFQWLKNEDAFFNNSCMVIYEVDAKTHTLYNEDRTIVGRIGNSKLLRLNPEFE